METTDPLEMQAQIADLEERNARQAEDIARLEDEAQFAGEERDAYRDALVAIGEGIGSTLPHLRGLEEQYGKRFGDDD